MSASTLPRKPTSLPISTEGAAARPNLVIEGRANRFLACIVFWLPAIGTTALFAAKGLFVSGLAAVTVPFCGALALGASVATIGLMTVPRPLVTFHPEGVVVANTFGRRRELLYADVTWIGRRFRGWQHIGRRGRLFSKVSAPTTLMTKAEYHRWNEEILRHAPWLQQKRGTSLGN